MAARYQGFKRVLFTINAAAEVVNKLIEINRIIRASQPRPKRNFPLGAPAIVGGPVSVSLGPEAIINKPELAILKL